MAEDWSINVKKYVPDADDGIIAGIVRYCGIALQKRDSSLVSFGDTKETDRVRENYLKKKLALTNSDDDLNQAIAAVGERMKGENFKNRVTVYYLLAERFGMLGLFGKGGAAVAGGAAAAAAGVAGLASLGGKDDAEPVAAPVPEPAAAAPIAAVAAVGAAAAGGVAAAASSLGSGAQALTGDSYGAADAGETSGGLGWLKWLLLALAALLLLWWLFFRQPAAAPTAEPAPAETAAAVAPGATEAAAPAAPPPAEGTVTIPTGAGVTTETRDGKPVVKVYFDTGKANIVDAFAPAAGAMKAYLDSHAGSTLGVSGFADKRGNAAANAELSKKRAQAVKAALVTSGIPDAAVELIKPADAVEATEDLAGARRVEVFVK